MSEREPTGETQQQQRPQQRNANINVHRRGGPPKKPGKDRRMSLRTKQFDDNMHRKMDGEEVPKTLKVSVPTKPATSKCLRRSKHASCGLLSLEA